MPGRHDIRSRRTFGDVFAAANEWKKIPTEKGDVCGAVGLDAPGCETVIKALRFSAKTKVGGAESDVCAWWTERYSYFLSRKGESDNCHPEVPSPPNEVARVAPADQLTQRRLADPYEREAGPVSQERDVGRGLLDQRRLRKARAFVERLPSFLERTEIPPSASWAHSPQPAPREVEGDPAARREVLQRAVPAEGRWTEETVRVHGGDSRLCQYGATLHAAPPARLPYPWVTRHVTRHVAAACDCGSA